MIKHFLFRSAVWGFAACVFWKLQEAGELFSRTEEGDVEPCRVSEGCRQCLPWPVGGFLEMRGSFGFMKPILSDLWIWIPIDSKIYMSFPSSWESRRGSLLWLYLKHGTDWFKVGKGVCLGCILSPCLFNFSAEYSMWNAGLDESQVGIKVARRNINNLRYADTTLMAGNEEDVKNLLMRMKEESEKAGVKLHIQKKKMMAFCPITSWQIEGGKVETVPDFIFLGSKITAALN